MLYMERLKYYLLIYPRLKNTVKLLSNFQSLKLLQVKFTNLYKGSNNHPSNPSFYNFPYALPNFATL